jgi:hypothetical protein
MKTWKVLLCLVLVFGILGAQAVFSETQTKTIRKTVKKVVRPDIAPATPPGSSDTRDYAPTSPPSPDKIKMDKDKGIFGWNLNTDFNVLYNLSPSAAGLRANLVFPDPLMIGEKLGLSQDAVEYKLGTGIISGNDSNNVAFKSIPLFAEAVLYLKEGSLFGLDPFLGAGLNYNAYGSGQVSGGMGYQAYAGILSDLGLGSGKTGFSAGYSSYSIGETIKNQSVMLMITQPVKF